MFLKDLLMIIFGPIKKKVLTLAEELKASA